LLICRVGQEGAIFGIGEEQQPKEDDQRLFVDVLKVAVGAPIVTGALLRNGDPGRGRSWR
jgi:hypothetical protein